jgi:hypothetical protein
MPAGNLTIDVSFTTEKDKTSAYLRWFRANAGAVIQGSQADDYAYMVILPHDFVVETGESMLSVEEGEEVPEESPELSEKPEGFRISAQPENQDATLILQAGSPDALEEGDLLGTDLPFKEGLTEYTITVFPEEESSPSKTYYIKVIKLPDLSLKTFKITKDSYEKGLTLSHDTQTHYIPFMNGFKIETVTNDEKADVLQSPSSIPPLNQSGDPTHVTVTVSKNLDGVPDEYRKKNYTLNLHYDADVAYLTPMATGGISSFIPGETQNSFYEVHIFMVEGDNQTTATKEQVESVLTFNAKPASGTVEVLVVAGGGGGGWSTTSHIPGGGGAGGYISHDAYDISGDADTFAVKVGLGGKPPASVTGGYGSANKGSNGGNSQFGADDSDKRIEAFGGGGGASHGNSIMGAGAKGGSGGGGSASGAGGGADAGVAPDGAIKLASNGSKSGGGGAGGAAQSSSGGKGFSSDISGDLRWYAGGGSAGTANPGNADSSDNPPEAYGAKGGANGEPGTGDGGGSAGAGGSGIVIVRFLHSQTD